MPCSVKAFFVAKKYNKRYYKNHEKIILDGWDGNDSKRSQGKQMKALTPHKERLISAQEYLKETQKHAQNIASVRFIPPKVGGRGFGKFYVEYKIPVLVEAK